MNQKAQTTKSLFSRETSVTAVINTSSEKIWQILTNFSGYKNWNSTIVSIEGDVRVGGRIKLVSTLDPKRTFALRVKVCDPTSKLVWGDMMGSRTYLLQKDEQGTLFTMAEKIGGPLFPLFASMIPSFDESFDAFAQDLKTEAERNNN